MPKCNLVFLTDCATGKPAAATLVRLSAARARELDARWWSVPGLAPGAMAAAEDRSWNWEALVAEAERDGHCECWAIMHGREVEAALILRTNALSVREAGVGAVYVEYLAVAPRNRRGVARRPCRRGAGTALLRHAQHRSAALGGGGRILLSALPGAHQFYLGRGFVDTGRRDDTDLPLLELPAGVRLE